MSLSQQLWLTDRCCHSTMRLHCCCAVLFSRDVKTPHCGNFQLVKLFSYNLTGLKYPAFEIGFCCVQVLVFVHACWTAHKQMPRCMAALQETCWGGQLPCRCQLTSPSRRLRSMTLPLTRFLLLQLVRSVPTDQSPILAYPTLLNAAVQCSSLCKMSAEVAGHVRPL